LFKQNSYFAVIWSTIYANFNFCESYLRLSKHKHCWKSFLLTRTLFSISSNQLKMQDSRVLALGFVFGWQKCPPQDENYANFGSPKHNSFISQKCYIEFPCLKLSKLIEQTWSFPRAWRFHQKFMYQIPFSHLKHCLYFNVPFMALSIPF